MVGHRLGDRIRGSNPGMMHLVYAQVKEAGIPKGLRSSTAPKDVARVKAHRAGRQAARTRALADSMQRHARSSETPAYAFMPMMRSAAEMRNTHAEQVGAGVRHRMNSRGQIPVHLKRSRRYSSGGSRSQGPGGPPRSGGETGSAGRGAPRSSKSSKGLLIGAGVLGAAALGGLAWHHLKKDDEGYADEFKQGLRDD